MSTAKSAERVTPLSVPAWLATRLSSLPSTGPKRTKAFTIVVGGLISLLMVQQFWVFQGNGNYLTAGSSSAQCSQIFNDNNRGWDSNSSNSTTISSPSGTGDIDSNSQMRDLPPILRLGPIFYNFFVPHGSSDDDSSNNNYNNYNPTENAVRIAAEQMVQRNMSEPGSLLLYTLIGHPNVTITDEFCQPNCYQREYLEEGDEIDTYQALWNHCFQHPDDLVTYIHDRGSFHSTSMNEPQRRNFHIQFKLCGSTEA